MEYVMKKILFTALLMMGVALSAAAIPVDNMTEPDTLVSVDNPEKIVFTESPGGIKLRMEVASDSVLEYNYNRDSSDVEISACRRTRPDVTGIQLLYRTGSVNWDLVFGGFGWGLVNAVGAPSGMHVEAAKSFELSWMYILGLRAYWNRYNWITLGVGYDWKNYALNSTTRFVKDDGTINVMPYPEEAHSGSSRLRLESLSISLIYGHRIARNTGIHVGSVFNVTTGSSLKTVYEVGRNRQSDRTNGIYARKYTLDIYGAVTYRGWGVYARYSPMSLIKSGRGPQFSTISAGIVWAL